MLKKTKRTCFRHNFQYLIENNQYIFNTETLTALLMFIQQMCPANSRVFSIYKYDYLHTVDTNRNINLSTCMWQVFISAPSIGHFSRQITLRLYSMTFRTIIFLIFLNTSNFPTAWKSSQMIPYL